MVWLILILWFILSSLALIQYGAYCSELNNIDKMIVMIIFLIGGPFFALVNILTAILDLILPEGWDDDDFKGY